MQGTQCWTILALISTMMQSLELRDRPWLIIMLSDYLKEWNKTRFLMVKPSKIRLTRCQDLKQLKNGSNASEPILPISIVQSRTLPQELPRWPSRSRIHPPSRFHEPVLQFQAVITALQLSMHLFKDGMLSNQNLPAMTMYLRMALKSTAAG